MKRSALAIAIISFCSTGCSRTSHRDSQQPADNHWLLIQAPHSPAGWPGWRQELRHWKDSLLSTIKYDDTYYSKPEYRWAASAYSTLFLMANDRALYDERWHYNIKGYLGNYEKNFGGVDIVLLWATYPQLGFDNRDQFSFYRNMPGGTAALKALCDELHAMGKKFFIAYNPWDNLARQQGRNDEEELISLVKETGADGIFLDTISSVKGFREKLDDARPGVVFQSEMGPDPAELAGVQQSWFELPVWYDPMKNSELDEVPYILRDRWLEQRHMVYHLSRWSHEQSGVIQNAWMNGCGVVIWENVFGTMNELNARDRSLLRSMLPILRRYSSLFTRGKWTPLYPTWLYRTYSSLWESGDTRLWTIINRQEQPAMGKILEIAHKDGTKYFDLVTGKEAATVIAGGKASIYMQLAPRSIACILAIDSSRAHTATGDLPVTDSNRTSSGLAVFLALQAKTYERAETSYSYQLPPHILKLPAQTIPYGAGRLPTGMVPIPVPPDSFSMTVHFRQRECGFYPADGVTDISYTMALDQTGAARGKIRLHPFAMDETPVTNAQYKRFLKATGYQPTFPENFLRNWLHGEPPKGQENYPVVWITIDDARAYARWAGKRLPTEQEWQWAAQGGEKARLYPWGDKYDPDLCNNGQSGGATDAKQFEKGRTAHGLYDMCGNVWQFTESERSDGHNTYCILRGGSWYQEAHASAWNADQGPQPANFSAKYLFTWPGLDRCATIGFRCVVDLR
jgi:iron(II)-dependent oxidoreductase